MPSLEFTLGNRRCQLMSASGALRGSSLLTAILIILLTLVGSATAQLDGGDGFLKVLTFARSNTSSSTLLNLRGIPLGQDLATFLRGIVADDVNDVSKPPGAPPLRRLQALDLSGTNISGGIPPELGNLTSLVYLNLSSNLLSGPIPPELSRLSKLRYLDLSANELLGPLSPQLESLFFRRLKVLDLSSNKLSGPVSINVNTWRLSELPEATSPWSIVSVPDKAAGRQKGAVKSVFLEDSATRPLTHLDLSSNGFCEMVPNLFTFARLKYLNLSSNHFSGKVASNIWSNSAGLQTVDLSFNPDLVVLLWPHHSSVDPPWRSSSVDVNLQGTKLEFRLGVKEQVCAGLYPFNLLTSDGPYPSWGAQSSASRGSSNRCPRVRSDGWVGGRGRQRRLINIPHDFVVFVYQNQLLYLVIYLPQLIVIVFLVFLFYKQRR
eukprot:TRINITY_DN19036_c0_g1_i1.p1 TRINITY_DN19036_c0_g1~~TRINITY_DN19036_c0_g1_i1.p1  ORF type:complete len:435 (+),score=23.94 TRINITY_DN19036_c0_g1_i1:236-1540(+)